MLLTTAILNASDPGAIQRASALLCAGELVAFPTETVYGLGANGLDASAVQRIFQAKGRPGDNPLILHVCSIEQALPLWQASDRQLELAGQLAAAFWPGPLSLVLNASPAVPAPVRAGLRSVAVRAPANRVAQQLLRACGFPLAAPSANQSGRPSPTRAEHVVATLGGRIAAIVDAGATDLGIESTVLDIRDWPPQILRPGTLSAAAIAAVVGEAVGEVGGPDNRGNGPSPGLRHHHYQPLGIKLRLLDATSIRCRWRDAVAILCRQPTAARLGERQAPLLSLPADAAGYGAQLYNALYAMEQSGATTLLVEKPPATPQWQAINDRLQRAAEN